MFYCTTDYKANCETACKNVTNVWSDIFSTADVFNGNMYIILLILSLVNPSLRPDVELVVVVFGH